MKTIKLDDGKEMYIPDGWDFYNCGEVLSGDKLIGLRKLPDPNPMPKLEVGAWYEYQDGWIHKWRDDSLDRKAAMNNYISEIRKADGTVWRRG